MWKLIIIFSLIGFLDLSSAQLVQFGQCDPNLQLASNFNLTEFAGRWYSISRTSSVIQNGDCATLDVTIAGDSIAFVNEAVNNNFREVITANATLQAGTARFTLNTSISNDPIEFSILGTDHTNYALAFTCLNRGANQRDLYVWQLGRESEIRFPLLLILMNQTLSNNFGITLADLMPIEHSERACHILPNLSNEEPIILPGQCDQNITVLQNFDANRFSGIWHNIASYYTNNQMGTCQRAQYTLTGSVVDLVNSEVINQTLRVITGSAVVISDDGSARLNVTIQATPIVTNQRKLFVLASDYDNYAVSYACENLPNDQRRVSSWIISRNRTLSPSTQQSVNAVIESYLDLNEQFFTQIDQSDESCFYFPEPAEDRPVVFRGQCDLNIPAMANFNASRYLGRWHNIASYPSVWENGNCSNAVYSLGDGVVNVLNSQVINMRLDTMEGFAVVSSTDGSAKLDVTFPVAGTNLTVTISYWVLDTDYESYALVYSCENLNAEEMQVWSWKLGRRRNLTDEANIAISRIIDSIQILDERYYVDVDQSQSGCFFIPEPQPGVPVVFSGQCDTTIPVVANFNMTLFEGTWYEFAAYPKEQQQGQCISHLYSALSTATNTLRVNSSSVVDQFLALTDGVMSFSSTDGSGRLTLTMSTTAGEISFPFWILGVDYNDYALAYSCVNIDEYFQGVYSWKLTRTRGVLSTTANITMNSIIASHIVLNRDYFEDIDQSDDACFSLPELQPGEPIILPGQCDRGIPVVQNFNASRYAGLWRLIESYYAEAQTGDCNDATYTLDNSGVIVFNTQVINQTLDTITGSAVLASDDGSARLLVQFPGTPVQAEYWVLDTDYDSYALVYSCVNVTTETRRVWSWKLSRTNALSATAEANINQVVNSIQVLNNRFFEKINRTDEACFYYPEADPGNPVIFRGKCDENIPVVTTFEPARYMNLWHDIESYPTGFQDGTCNNAFYTLIDGEVDVFNTQVVNQTLGTINGVARLVSTANIAKLIVSFPIAGTNLTTFSDYWVLATDYDNYALVYSCVNLDDNRRRVNSWKLSRTKSLSVSSIIAINSVMESIPVLRNQYFIQRDQSPSGCFFFPVPQPGVPVEFPGQCDNNIQAVTNFNLTAFSDSWYEIEAYPKDPQPGQCVNHLYTVGTATTFNLQSSSVLDLNRTITISSAALTSTDGSGRLNITTPAGTSQVTFPFWILDTDYTDYALAYSCVNIREDFRTVYSWKLSRSRQLSAQANTSINNFIENSNIEVLQNKYFEEMDQSDEACFFLPKHVPGQPVVFPGQCDDTIPVVQNFSAARYGGRWRLIESYPTLFQDGTCQEATYELNGTEVIVFNTQVIDQSLDTINGTATLATTDGSAKLKVLFPNSTVPADYWVLDTDYDSYALVYSCRNISANERLVTSWKLSRDRQLSQAAITNINRVVNTINVLDQRYFEVMNQSDSGCFYLPEPDPTRSVVFRGRCDQNISVVTNFDPVRYQGLWHDIQSYPTRFQDGTCNNANYTLVDGEVDVFNTQVVNQRLDTINAVARLATNDSSAKLLVTFPIAGTNLTVTTDYWVLATDYDSYALIYSCQDLDDDRRQVSSWKLSRERQLSNASETAINAVIEQIPVLDNSYYIERDHSPEGCFYFPDPVPGQPVRFRGQCADIQAKANFSLALFQGLWHEIEAYPKEQQTGQCINHALSAGTGNTLNLESSSVSDLQLNITRGSVAITSPDGSGRLTIVIVVDGAPIAIPFWILETDYTDFALAYACVDINADLRGVYSWKLSRTRELSVAAGVAINNTISSIDVLDQMYYEKVDQSDEACFYLPDLGPDDPVVFRGRCDPNIPVVQNFDPVRYASRWRMIETYSADFQNGSCNDATYTLLPNNTVLVYNTQVNNETLQSIEGTAVLATTDGSAKLLVTFPGTPEPAEYWVLDTDYDSYSLVYSCRNLNNETRRVWSWKLSRTSELSAAAVANISRVVDSINVLDNRFFQSVNQSDEACFYYPTPDGNPVSFRGPCDENIPVVQNINLARYMGTWYDIESYPQAFQDGTCPTATYDLSANGVDVFNTQVVAQELDTINATAVPAAANDTSARFIVTFPIAGTDLVRTTPYWVLATDYDSFALVYACTNDGDRRRVGSWKLSRTRSLTANATETINRVMEQVPVLRQQYFNVRGHTDEDCFYYPDNNGGPVILRGQCYAEQDVVTNFNAANFSGTWYEVSRFPSQFQTGECATNTLAVNGSSLTLTQTIVYNERLVTVSGPVVPSPDGRGVLTAQLTGSGVTIETTLHILSTDYTDHALIMSCANIDANQKQIFSWKLSRSREGFSNASGAIIDSIVNSNIDLFHRFFEETDQTNNGCFYYPVFDVPPATITLTGPCDETIRGKANFSAGDYLGRWFEIARYPVTFQFGECARAEYIADVDAVRVLNSEVVNKRLDIMIGSAVLATNDSTGVLNVTFAFDNGVVNTANYYILETDYNNFALVYSCRNLENNRRQVSSWKLSRTRSLSNESLAIMDEVIVNTQGLLQEYYLSTRQDEDACFYIPEVNRDEAPQFRGQCQNVTGVQNFDPQRYIGWWHEIERYPTDVDVGVCISSDFRASGDQFVIVDTNIFDVTAQINTSTVVVSNDGRLRKTFSDGRVVDIWVLATDYETYSLLYSCENINDEYMRVWSAKHSKTRSLTAAAQNAMDLVIQDNRVLLQDFFIPVDQSADACFHYPEQTGTRIILPGQCDENIPVMQSFDVAQYSGTWFQIERYPSRYENGTCTGARYTPNLNTGVVAVLNWQVVDGTLDSVEGTANVTSTDGSARLRVRLPVRHTGEPNPPMVETDLWILTTDYIRYSLAYTCVNINEFERAVGAWKLSRGRTMSSAGTTAINNFMATRRELHQPFFLEVVQNADCLEPSSAMLFQSSIIILLICAFLQILV